MIKAFIKLMTVLTVLSVATQAYAASPGVQDQIQAALSAGNYTEIQGLVTANPTYAGQTELLLLDQVQANLTKSPQTAAQIMTLVSNLTPFMSENDALPIVARTRKLVSAIVEMGAVNPDKTEIYASIFNSAITIAKTKVVEARDPDLANWVEASLTNYADDNDILLAQIPSQNFFNPNLNRFYIPSGSNSNGGTILSPSSISNGSPS